MKEGKWGFCDLKLFVKTLKTNKITCFVQLFKLIIRIVTMPEAKKVAKNTKLNLLNLKMANLSANVITSENSDSDLKWNLKKTIFDTKKMPKYTQCFFYKTL